MNSGFRFRVVIAAVLLSCAPRGDDAAIATDTSDAAASETPLPSPGAQPPNDESWQTIESGANSAGYALAEDGTVSYRGRTLTPPVLLREPSDANSAIAYQVSPTSPSGRWALAQGRGNTFGRVYILDLEQGTTRETPVTKYGIMPWVAWAPALPYAIVSNRVEGTALLYRIDLTSGEARHIDFTSVVPAPLSATPAESTLRWQDDEGRSFVIDARVACNSAVERCDGAPAQETRRFRVETRTLQVTATSDASRATSQK